MNRCQNCGADAGADNPPTPQHCGNCPPWRCEDCGEIASTTDLCQCWTSLEGMALADLKALFADDCTGPGLSLDAPKAEWWLCPNEPPCPHGAVLHDIAELGDQRPTCCVTDCTCGRGGR